MTIRLLANEWIGLGLALTYLFLGFAFVWLVEQISLFAILLYLLYWIVALACIFGRGVDASEERHLSRAHKVRAILAIPLLVTGAKVVDVAFAPGGRLAAAIALGQRSGEMRAAQREAGPGRAAAIGYQEGIPDGGVKLIRFAAGNPEDLPVEEHLRLTGERIKGCGPLGAEDWICSYD